ncbi:MAG: IPT/TIG domain-containing protein, partial [Elusimicrobiota bacterium]|nr:IPT/TIG domain-containing protein [Elusimicrobiota bacterium]
MKKFLISLLMMFLMFIFIGLYSFVSADVTSISPNRLNQGEGPVTVTIITNSDIDEPTTWKDDVSDVGVSIPGCSIEEVSYLGKRAVSAKVTVMRDAVLGPQTVTVVYGSGSQNGSLLTIVSKPMILSCIPIADYQRTGASLTIYGKYFNGGNIINFAGVTVTQSAGSLGSPATIISISSLDLSAGTPGGPYMIGITAGDTGIGMSEDGQGNMQQIFTLYPKPTISGISKSKFYQGQESIQLRINGTGFHTDSSVEISGDGITIADTVATPTQIVVNLSIDRDTAIGNRTITVINPDGKSGRANNVTYSSITITPKITPKPSINSSYEQGYEGEIIINSTTGTGEGFDEEKLPTVTSNSEDVTIESVSRISKSQLNVYVKVSPTAVVGNRTLTINNETYDTSGICTLVIAQSAKSKLETSTIKINNIVATDNLTPITINQGQISTFTITATNAEFAPDVSVTAAEGEGITVKNVIFIDKTTLWAYIQADSKATLGQKTLLIKNATYNSARAVYMTITESDYNKIANLSIAPSEIYQGVTSTFTITAGTGEFEDNPTLTTISGTGLTLVLLGKKTSNSLSVAITADKAKNTLGDHYITVQNPNYVAISTVTLKVSTSSYNNPQISGSPVTLYQGDKKEITITGSGFSDSAIFSCPEENIVISTITVSSTQAIINVEVKQEIEEGYYSLIVKNPEFDATQIRQDFFLIKEKHDITDISPNMVAPETEYSFYINGTNFDTTSNFKILIDGNEVKNFTTGDVSNEIVFVSSVCVSKVQVSCTILVGSNVISGTHDVGLYFENNNSTATKRGILTIPNRPIITEIANTVSQGDTNKDVVIQGQNFERGASVVISGSGIIISTVTVTSENSITFRCDVNSSAEKTDREIKVINPTGLFAIGILKVIAPPIIESCSPTSVMRGTTRYLEIKGQNFNKNFKLTFSGNFMDISTYTATDQNNIIQNTSETEKYIYLLDAYYTGNTQITANAYISPNVESGLYDIGVVNYIDSTNTTIESQGQGDGLFDVRTPLKIVNSSVTVPVGYERKSIILKGEGFSADSEISISGSGVSILSENTRFINSQEMEIVISVSENAPTGMRTVTIRDRENTTYLAFLEIIPSVEITKVEPSILGLGLKLATMTITGSRFEIEWDTTQEITFPGTTTKGYALKPGQIEIIGGGINSIAIDTTTYNSNYIQLYCIVESTATIGSRDLRITNKDNENSALKEIAFSIEETVEVDIFNPQNYQVKDTLNADFIITGRNFDIATWNGSGTDPKYVKFLNNDKLKIIEITGENDTEIKGKFKWDGNTNSNLGNRSVDIQITNLDGTIGTLKGGLYLSEPLSIESVSPSIIPINANNFLITVKGKGILNNADVYFFTGIDETIPDQNIIIKKREIINSNEILLYIDTTQSLTERSDIYLFIENFIGNSTSTLNSSITIESKNIPNIHTITPNSMRVGGTMEVTITGHKLDEVTNYTFSHGIIVSSTTLVSPTETRATLKTNANSYAGDVSITISTVTGPNSESAIVNKGKFTLLPAPTIREISPAIFYRGISSILNIEGENFAISSSGNGVKVIIKKVDSNTIVPITADKIVTSNNRVIITGIEFESEGIYSITIQNFDESNVTLEKAITVYPPGVSAVINSITPQYGKANESNKFIEVTGASFLPGMSIYALGGGITVSTYTVYTSSATLNLNIASDATLGANKLVFSNPNATKTEKDFYVMGTPIVSSVSPQSLTQGTTAEIKIGGSNFVYTATELGKTVEYIKASISGDGITVISASVTFISANHIQATIYVDDDATIGKRDIVVTNPFSMIGLGTSLLNIVAPVKISTTTPNEVAQGDKNRNMIITGSGFQENITVEFAGTGVSVIKTTFISDTQISVDINIEDNAEIGSRAIKITNPDAVPVTISNVLNIGPKIIVERTNPSQIGRGVTNKYIEIIGNNFDVSTNTVKITGTGITLGSATTNGATSITVPLTIDANTMIGSRDITVTTARGSSGTGSGVLEIVDIVQITSIDPKEIPIYKNAFKIWNQEGANTSATYRVVANNFEIKINGSITTSITINPTTTISDLINTINTYFGDGWVAQEINTKTSSQLASNLALTDEINVLNSTATVSFNNDSVWNSQELTFEGSGFLKEGDYIPNIEFSGAGISVSGIKYTGSSQIKGTLSFKFADIEPGKRDVKIINPDGTFGILNGAIEFMNALEISGYNPSVVGKGVNNGLVKIYGSGFTSGTRVRSENAEITVSDVEFIGREQLWFKVTVPSTYAPTEAKFTIYNTNNDQAEVTVPIEKIPIVSEIEPAQVGQGSSTTIVMKGDNLGNIKPLDYLSKLYFNGSDISILQIFNVTNTEVSAIINVSKSAQTGKRTLTVKAEVEGIEKTGTIVDILEITSAPTITSITPNTLIPDTTNLLTIQGSGFKDGATLKFTTQDNDLMLYDYNYQNDSRFALRVYVTENTVPGTYDVTIINPDNSNGTTLGILTITEPLKEPQITSVDPAQMSFGSNNQTISVTGTGFEEGFSATFSGNEITISTTSFISDTSLRLTLSVSQPTDAVDGYRTIYITNPTGKTGSASNV